MHLIVQLNKFHSICLCYIINNSNQLPNVLHSSGTKNVYIILLLSFIIVHIFFNGKGGECIIMNEHIYTYITNILVINTAFILWPPILSIIFKIINLFNSLPKYLRDIESAKTEKFKFKLDKFLELIPDQPNMPNYVTSSGSNSILDQLTHLRAQGIYQSGGVPDSAMEQS